MTQDIDGNRAIMLSKKGKLAVPEPLIRGHLVQKDERSAISRHLIGDCQFIELQDCHALT
jgi:hypothetical protein